MSVKRFIKTYLRWLLPLMQKIRFAIFRVIGSISPILLAKILFMDAHPGYRLNLKSPKTLADKVNWLKFNTNTEIWSQLADKYLVRDFVIEKGLEETLNPIYGIYDRPEDIDFGLLPNSFVIKTTNGGAGVQVEIIRDKSEINQAQLIHKLNTWLKQQSPIYLAEPHYLKIKPRILVEKLLNDGSEGGSLVDYKFNCFDGKVYSIFLCYGRSNGSVHHSIYDRDWNIHHECMTSIHHHNEIFPKPNSFEKMIEYSEILSKGFPFVRVDWYEIEGTPVFSEMTFTPGGGYFRNYTMEYLEEMGEQLILPQL